MLFDLFALMTLDGLATVMNSPFVIPVAGCVMILGMSATSMWAKVRSEEIKSHERLARIAQGLPADTPTTWDEVTMKAAAESQDPGMAGVAARAGKVNDGSGARRAGVVLVSIGLGLFFFFALLAATLQVRAVFSGAVAGVLPLAIGIGFLVDARHKKEEYERRVAAGWYPMPGQAFGAAQPVSGAAPPPPPPPVGMTAAQASDWRPLH